VIIVVPIEVNSIATAASGRGLPVLVPQPVIGPSVLQNMHKCMLMETCCPLSKHLISIRIYKWNIYNLHLTQENVDLYTRVRGGGMKKKGERERDCKGKSIRENFHTNSSPLLNLSTNSLATYIQVAPEIHSPAQEIN
jgi:hypothetical protein